MKLFSSLSGKLINFCVLSRTVRCLPSSVSLISRDDGFRVYMATITMEELANCQLTNLDSTRWLDSVALFETENVSAVCLAVQLPRLTSFDVLAFVMITDAACEMSYDQKNSSNSRCFS